MAKRLGVLLVFKEDVTKLEVFRALSDNGMRTIIDTDYYSTVQLDELINEFDDEDGGPVWYIP